MRIAFVSTMDSTPWGGSEELWSGAAACLAREGHDVIASVPAWPEIPPGIHALRSAGVRLAFRPRPGLATRLARRALGRDAGADFRGFLRRERPAFVVISEGWTGDGIDAMLACEAAGVPYAPLVQANCELWWPVDAVRERWRRAYGRARRVFFVAERNATLLQEQLGLSLAASEVVWNPWKVRVPETTSWPSGHEPRLACVARLDIHAKGQDVLLRALAHSDLRRLSVDFYGTGDQREGLQAMAAHLGLENVRFAGQASDMNAVWDRHHLLVLPSRLEGSSLALIEAMWCGRPAVVTDVGGNAALCEDGVTGFVAEAAAPATLARTLERALAARDGWPALGRAARERIARMAPRDPLAAFGAAVLRAAGQAEGGG